MITGMILPTSKSFYNTQESLTLQPEIGSHLLDTSALAAKVKKPSKTTVLFPTRCQAPLALERRNSERENKLLKC